MAYCYGPNVVHSSVSRGSKVNHNWMATIEMMTELIFRIGLMVNIVCRAQKASKWLGGFNVLLLSGGKLKMTYITVEDDGHGSNNFYILKDVLFLCQCVFI